MQISQASLADISALCLLVNSAYRGDTSRKGWTTEADLLGGIRVDETTLQHYLEDANSVILKAENENSELLGCVYLRREQQQLYLGMLTVSPGLQGRGTGKLLMKSAEDKAKEMGCKKIVMTVISTRTELIDWYERHGYNKTGRTQPFPTDEKFGIPKTAIEFLVMEKII